MGAADVIARFLDELFPAFQAGDPAVHEKVAEAACVRLVEGLYRAIVGGDVATFLALLDEDIDFENVGPAVIPWVGRWRGRATVADAMARNFGYVDEQRPEVISVVAQGDTVIVVGRETGRYRPTGREYETHWVHRFTWREGRLVRLQQVSDTAKVVEAVMG